MRSGTLGVLALCTVALLCTSCNLFGPRKPPVPEWIPELPQESGFVYATGQYYGALNPNDNFKNAVQVALANLAQSLSTDVESNVELRYRNADFSARYNAKNTSSATVVNATLVGQWVDMQGHAGTTPGTVWVLMKCPRVSRRPAAIP